jgi:hypothetical protein
MTCDGSSRPHSCPRCSSDAPRLVMAPSRVVWLSQMQLIEWEALCDDCTQKLKNQHAEQLAVRVVSGKKHRS